MTKKIKSSLLRGRDGKRGSRCVGNAEGGEPFHRRPPGDEVGEEYPVVMAVALIEDVDRFGGGGEGRAVRGGFVKLGDPVGYPLPPGDVDHPAVFVGLVAFLAVLIYRGVPLLLGALVYRLFSGGSWA